MKERFSSLINRFKTDRMFALTVGAFALCVLAAYLLLVHGGPVSYDEMQVAINCRENGLDLSLLFCKFPASFSRSCLGWTLYLLNYLQAITDSELVYRFFTLAGVLFSVFCFMRLLLHRFDRPTAACAGLLFLLCAQYYGPQMSGFTTFTWDYQFRFGFLFLSFDLFYRYFDTGSKKALLGSALLYFYLLELYEAFLCFSVLYFLLALTHYGLRRWKKIIGALLPHFVFSLLFLAVLLFGRRIIAQSGDAFTQSYLSVAKNVTFPQRLHVILLFTFAHFPLRAYSGGFASFYAYWADFSVWRLIGLCAALVAVVVFCLLLRKLPCLSTRSFILLECFCLLGAVLPCIPFGFSANYISQVFSSGLNSYGVSFYSYFFLIGALLALIVWLYSLVRKSVPTLQTPFLLLLGTVLFVVGLLTQVICWNEAKSLDKRDNQNELFRDVVTSQSFEQVPEGSMVYAPAHVGVHNRMETLRQYAACCNDGKQVDFANDLKYVTFEVPTYYLRDDFENDAEFFGLVNNEFCADTITIWAQHDLTDYSLVGHLRSDAPQRLIVGDITTEVSGGDFVLNLADVIPSGTTLLLYNPDFVIDMESLALIPNS